MENCLSYARTRNKSIYQNTKCSNVIFEVLLESFYFGHVKAQPGATNYEVFRDRKMYSFIIVVAGDDTLFEMHCRNCYLLTGFSVDTFLSG